MASRRQDGGSLPLLRLAATQSVGEPFEEVIKTDCVNTPDIEPLSADDDPGKHILRCAVNIEFKQGIKTWSVVEAEGKGVTVLALGSFRYPNSVDPAKTVYDLVKNAVRKKLYDIQREKKNVKLSKEGEWTYYERVVEPNLGKTENISGKIVTIKPPLESDDDAKNKAGGARQNKVKTTLLVEMHMENDRTPFYTYILRADPQQMVHLILGLLYTPMLEYDANSYLVPSGPGCHTRIWGWVNDKIPFIDLKTHISKRVAVFNAKAALKTVKNILRKIYVLLTDDERVREEDRFVSYKDDIYFDHRTRKEYNTFKTLLKLWQSDEREFENWKPTKDDMQKALKFRFFDLKDSQKPFISESTGEFKLRVFSWLGENVEAWNADFKILKKQYEQKTEKVLSSEDDDDLINMCWASAVLLQYRKGSSFFAPELKDPALFFGIPPPSAFQSKELEESAASLKESMQQLFTQIKKYKNDYPKQAEILTKEFANMQKDPKETIKMHVNRAFETAFGTDLTAASVSLGWLFALAHTPSMVIYVGTGLHIALEHLFENHQKTKGLEPVLREAKHIRFQFEHIASRLLCCANYFFDGFQDPANLVALQLSDGEK